MVYAALLEARRLALTQANMPAMNIMWQAPVLAMLGAAEVFAGIGILEFFYDRSPDGMKSLSNAFAQLSVAAGRYLNLAVLSAVAAITAGARWGARVDPGRPERGSPGLFLLDDGCSGHAEPAALLALLQPTIYRQHQHSFLICPRTHGTPAFLETRFGQMRTWFWAGSLPVVGNPQRCHVLCRGWLLVCWWLWRGIAACPVLSVRYSCISFYVFLLFL
jgi:hypothetical protein